MGENLIHPLMSWFSNLFKRNKSKIESIQAHNVDAISEATSSNDAPGGISTDTNISALHVVSDADDAFSVEKLDVIGTKTEIDGEQTDLGASSSESIDSDCDEQSSVAPNDSQSAESVNIQIRQADPALDDVAFANINRPVENVLVNADNAERSPWTDISEFIADEIEGYFLGTQERVFEGLRECDPLSEVLMTTSDKKVVLGVSMKGSDKHAMNEDGHRVGNMPDGRAYSLVCDGTSSPYGSWSFVSSFADQIARFMKTQSPNSKQELNSLVDRAFDECNHTLNTAATVMLAIELEDGSYLVYRNGDSVVAYKDKDCLLYTSPSPRD